MYALLLNGVMIIRMQVAYTILLLPMLFPIQLLWLPCGRSPIIQFGLPAFDWMLEMGAALIGTETELILKSRWVYPGRLLESGFRFRYTQIEDALRNIVQQTPQRQYHLFLRTKVAANL